jgi:hypothetical protein
MCPKRGQVLFKLRGGNCKNVKIKNYEARKAEFEMKAFLHLRRQAG